MLCEDLSAESDANTCDTPAEGYIPLFLTSEVSGDGRRTLSSRLW